MCRVDYYAIYHNIKNLNKYKPYIIYTYEENIYINKRDKPMYYNIPHQRNIVLLRSVTGNVYRVRGYESKRDSHEHTRLLTYSAEVVL